MSFLKYNDYSLDTTNGVGVSKVSGLSTPSIRVSQENITSANGVFIYNRLFGGRKIIINGFVRGDTEEEFFTNRKALIDEFAKTSGKLYITDWGAGNGYFVNVKVTEGVELVDVAGYTSFAEFKVGLTAEEPYIFDSTADEYSAINSAGTGFPIPAPIGMPLGSSAVNTMNIENETNNTWYLTVKFTSTDTLSKPRLTNQTTGDYFYIDRTINTGDYIDVSFDNYRVYVYLNGTDDISGDFVGDKFSIVSGVNKVVFSSTSGECSVAVIFYQPYAGI